jgi:hypothetical protein
MLVGVNEFLLNGERDGDVGHTPKRGRRSRWHTCVLCEMLVLSSSPLSCVCGLPVSLPMLVLILLVMLQGYVGTLAPNP